MDKKESARPNIRKVMRLIMTMIIGYAILIIGVIFVVTTLAVRKTDDVLEKKVISMSSSLNVQMKLNIDSYLERMETIGALAFGAEDTYTYDASDPNNDEFEAINTEKAITDKLFSLCIMDNFVDYGIVYSNNRTVGKISNGSIDLFGENMFDELCSMITEQRTKDGWAAGYKDNFKRIYYVKRVHNNAVLVLSFYTTELEAVFDNPETLKDMDIRLVNSDYNILYSSRENELGTSLPSDIRRRIINQTSASVMDDEYLVSVNSCGNDWFVICSIPTEIIVHEKNEMSIYIYAVGLIACLIAIIMGSLLSMHFVAPIKEAVDLLDVKASNDQLTGILNKQSFNERVTSRLKKITEYEYHAMIILDLDNFKGVNDTLGHAYGDIVLSKTGSILRAEFSTEDYLGRVGGDEFCIFVNAMPPEGSDYEEYIRLKCESLCTTFNNNYTGSDNSYKISASIGAAFYPKHGESFEELYAAADKALYRSKKTGKDTYSLFNPFIDKEASD